MSGQPDLAARVAALEAFIAHPQKLADLMERTVTDPKGGEPRIIDAAGTTLPYSGALQFLNATAAVDPASQRIIITPTGGGGSGMAAHFNEDGTTDDSERAKFESEVTPGTNLLTLDTLTSGTTREGILMLSEDVAAAAQPNSQTLLAIDAPSSAAIIEQIATGDASNALTEALQAFPGNVSWSAQAVAGGSDTGLASVAVVSGGLSEAQLTIATTAGSASLVAQDDRYDAAAGGRARVTAGAVPRQIIDDVARSDFMQVNADTVNATGAAPIQRVVRGPFVAAPGALGALASAAVNVSNATAGSVGSVALVGAVQGAAGCESVVWSWTFGVGVIVLSFTNLGAAPQTATLVFYTICDA